MWRPPTIGGYKFDVPTSQVIQTANSRNAKNAQARRVNIKGQEVTKRRKDQVLYPLYKAYMDLCKVVLRKNHLDSDSSYSYYICFSPASNSKSNANYIKNLKITVKKVPIVSKLLKKTKRPSLEITSQKGKNAKTAPILDTHDEDIVKALDDIVTQRDLMIIPKNVANAQRAGAVPDEKPEGISDELWEEFQEIIPKVEEVEGGLLIEARFGYGYYHEGFHTYMECLKNAVNTAAVYNVVMKTSKPIKTLKTVPKTLEDMLFQAEENYNEMVSTEYQDKFIQDIYEGINLVKNLCASKDYGYAEIRFREHVFEPIMDIINMHAFLDHRLGVNPYNLEKALEPLHPEEIQQQKKRLERFAKAVIKYYDGIEFDQKESFLYNMNNDSKLVNSHQVVPQAQAIVIAMDGIRKFVDENIKWLFTEAFFKRRAACSSSYSIYQLEERLDTRRGLPVAANKPTPKLPELSINSIIDGSYFRGVRDHVKQLTINVRPWHIEAMFKGRIRLASTCYYELVEKIKKYVNWIQEKYNISVGEIPIRGYKGKNTEWEERVGKEVNATRQTTRKEFKRALEGNNVVEAISINIASLLQLEKIPGVAETNQEFLKDLDNTINTLSLRMMEWDEDKYKVLIYAKELKDDKNTAYLKSKEEEYSESDNSDNSDEESEEDSDVERWETNEEIIQEGLEELIGERKAKKQLNALRATIPSHDWDPKPGGKPKTTKQKQYKRTMSNTIYKNRRHVVYQGPRGGRYIKSGGEYISLKKLGLN